MPCSLVEAHMSQMSKYSGVLSLLTRMAAVCILRNVIYILIEGI